MLLKNKGYSLTVLVIAIAVILIITTTAIMSIKGIDNDKEISIFMNDLEEVKQYVIEYYGNTNSLPVILDANGEMISAELDLINKFSGEGALSQLSEEDVGDYYRVDIEKLGKIHLKDYERDYIINEGTFNVYVTNPCEYQGDYYYTLTPYLLGKDVVVNYSTPFEINIIGNPITWSPKAEILVSIPNVEMNNADRWNFKWQKGAKSASDFKLGSEENYFTYGETITWTENGIYTIYVENPEKLVSTRKVVVSKVDNVPPTIKYVSGEIFIDDAETGIKNMRCKIKENINFDISGEYRLKYPEYYTMSGETALETEESLLAKYLWGDKDIRGDTVQQYLQKYEEYYDKITQYNAVMVKASSTSGEKENALAAIKNLNNTYPQFAYDNRRFPNTEKNIVLFVEDMAGNGAVYSAIDRYELIRCQYLSGEVETMHDSKVVANNNATYTNDRNVNLFLQSMYAKYVFLTEVQEPTPTWDIYDSESVNFELSSGDGEKVIYAFFKDDVGKIVGVYDKIHLDRTKPSKDAPTVSNNLDNLSIISNQKDSIIVDGVETQSGLSFVSYGVAEGEGAPFIWYNTQSAIPDLIEGVTYRFATKARDNAGNEQISDVTIFRPQTAAMMLKVGDYVNYVPDNKSYTPSTTGFGTSNSALQTVSDTTWRVLNVNESTGEVLLSTEYECNEVNISLWDLDNVMSEAKKVCEELYSNQSLGIKAENLDVDDLLVAFGVTDEKLITRNVHYLDNTTLEEGSYVSHNGQNWKVVLNDSSNFKDYIVYETQYQKVEGGEIVTGPGGKTGRKLTADKPVYLTGEYYRDVEDLRFKDILKVNNRYLHPLYMLNEVVGTSKYYANYANDWLNNTAITFAIIDEGVLSVAACISIGVQGGDYTDIFAFTLRPAIKINANTMIDISDTTKDGKSKETAWEFKD